TPYHPCLTAGRSRPLASCQEIRNAGMLVCQRSPSASTSGSVSLSAPARNRYVGARGSGRGARCSAVAIPLRVCELVQELKVLPHRHRKGRHEFLGAFAQAEATSLDQDARAAVVTKLHRTRDRLQLVEQVVLELLELGVLRRCHR